MTSAHLSALMGNWSHKIDGGQFHPIHKRQKLKPIFMQLGFVDYFGKKETLHILYHTHTTDGREQSVVKFVPMIFLLTGYMK